MLTGPVYIRRQVPQVWATPFSSLQWAALLTLTPNVARAVSQEAFVGIVYVVATAATILVVDRSPQGAEHVKKTRSTSRKS